MSNQLDFGVSLNSQVVHVVIIILEIKYFLACREINGTCVPPYLSVIFSWKPMLILEVVPCTKSTKL
jgi:hypothetical protein